MVGEEHAEHRQQDHAEAAPEVGAVDAGGEGGQVEVDRPAPAARRRTASDVGGDPWLDGEQGTAEQDQHRHDGLEDAGRSGEEDDRARRAAGHRGGPERHHPAALGGDLHPVGGGAAEVARPDGDGVRHVRLERGQPGGHQRGERDQRAPTGDGVDRTRDEAGGSEHQRSAGCHLARARPAG